MSTFENPDAAPGADAAPETVDTQATALPPVPETSAADAAQSAAAAQLDDITAPTAAHGAGATVVDVTPTAAHGADASPLVGVTPSAATEADATSALADLTPITAADADTRADGTSALADLEPPAPAPAALPPAFTGFAPGPDAASVPLVPAATDAAPAATASPSGPRTRWAAIVWGLVLAAIASIALWLLTDAERQAAATDWILSLTPAAVIAYSVLVLGAFALVAGLVGLVRRAQRAGERRRAASTSAV